LVTVRDPVARTVSWIHQQCNKNYGRMGEFQAVCDRCDYYEDKEGGIVSLISRLTTS
jgi:hypothetical protein